MTDVVVNTDDIARFRRVLGTVPGSADYQFKSDRQLNWEAESFPLLVDDLQGVIWACQEVVSEMADELARLRTVERDVRAMRRLFAEPTS